MEAGFRCNLLEFVWPKRHLPTNPAGPFPGGGGGYGSPAEVIIFGGFPSLFIGSTCINSFEAVCRTCFQRLLLPPQPACGGMPILLAFRHPMSYLTLSCLLWVVIFQWPFGDCIQKNPHCYAGAPEVLLELAATPGYPVHFEMCHFKALQGLDLGSKWDSEQVKH